MDARRDSVACGEDVVECHERDSGGHESSMADRPARDWDLRVCANSDMIRSMLDTTSVISSTEFDRQRYAAVGRALADPKRLCVLESLAAGEVSVSDLSTRVGCQVPNMSQHLAVLRSAGLVQSRRDGSTVFYRLADVRVLEAYRLIQSLAGQGA
jgi:DNA-binding transcriptional ArsR family regulator